jgi:uncharacterized protein Yka (UPF0111/DUF47 family)
LRLGDSTGATPEALRWKSLYDRLEDALTACEDVADELETIVTKHL